MQGNNFTPQQISTHYETVVVGDLIPQMTFKELLSGKELEYQFEKNLVFFI